MGIKLTPPVKKYLQKIVPNLLTRGNARRYPESSLWTAGYRKTVAAYYSVLAPQHQQRSLQAAAKNCGFYESTQSQEVNMAKLKVWKTFSVMMVLILVVAMGAAIVPASPVETQGSHLILFWDGDTIPDGWTCISDNTGEPFYNRFPRGSDTYGGQGGSAQHAHDLDTLLNPDPDAVFCSYLHVTKRTIADAGHDHDVDYSRTTGREGPNIPPYRSLKVIRCDTAGMPLSLPAGVIAIFHHDPPTGWTRYAAQDDLFVMGYSSITTGGSETHTHDLHVVTTHATTTDIASWGEFPSITEDHYHIIDLTTYEADNIPPYLSVILAKADKACGISRGLVGMFDSIPDESWELLSVQGMPYYQRFLKGSSVYGNTGGHSSHSHDIPKVGYTSYACGGETKWVLWSVFSEHTASYSGHRHPRFLPAYNDDILWVHDAESLPPYTDVIVAQYDPTVPVVKTEDATNITDTAATLNGEVSHIGADYIAERGFEWGTKSGTPYASSWTETGNFGEDSFSDNITNLYKGKVYYFRAKAKNNVLPVWSYGGELKFLTRPAEPTNLTAAAGDEKVELSWSKGQGANRTLIRRSTTGYPQTINDGDEVYFGTGTHYLDTGLTNLEHYYYSAWSEVTEGTLQQYSANRAEVDSIPEEAPTVITRGAAPVDETTATLNADVTDIFGEPVVERGFDWDNNSGLPYANSWTETGDFGVGIFSHNISNLDKGTVYYFRAKAKHNKAVWGWGEEKKVITRPDPPYNLTATGGTNEISLNWSKGEGAAATLIKRSTTECPQNPDEGNLVYFGTDTQYTDSNLDISCTYYYSAWSLASGDGIAAVSSEKATASIIATATGSGIATFTTSNGLITGLTAAITTPCGILSGFSFPHGFFSFNITNITPGSTVTITITLPSAVPVGTQYWKCQNGAWTNCTSLLGDDDGDDVLTLTIEDGGLGDADGAANGTIVDPGGPGLPRTTSLSPAPAKPRASATPPRPLNPAQMSVQYLSVYPQQTSAGQPVTITANVVNTGDEACNLNVALKINGQVEQTRTVSVGSLGTQPVKFIVTKSQPGTYTADIGGQGGTFTILGTGGTTGKAANGGMIALIAMVVLILVTAVVLLMAFRRHA
jgi:hypothetical protein